MEEGKKEGRWLRGLRIHILPARIGKVQLHVLHRRVLACGGVVEERWGAPTQVVCTAQQPGHLPTPPAQWTGHVLTLAWLTRSLEMGSCQPFSPYALTLPCTTPLATSPKPTPTLTSASPTALPVVKVEQPQDPSLCLVSSSEVWEGRMRIRSPLPVSPVGSPERDHQDPAEHQTTLLTGHYFFGQTPKRTDNTARKRKRQMTEEPKFTPVDLLSIKHQRLTDPTCTDSPSWTISSVSSSSSLSTPPSSPTNSPPRQLYVEFSQEDPSSYPQEPESTVSSSSSPPNTRLSPDNPRLVRRRKFFACQPSNGMLPERQNHNKAVTDILEVMLQKSEGSGDKWRAFAYRKAIAALRAHPTTITSTAQAKDLRGVGASIAEKIGEIIETGHLRKAEATDEIAETISVFTKIWGVGAETAKKWYAMGYRKLSDLPADGLTKPQRIGLKYYHEFQRRIPRAEAQQLSLIVRQAAKTVDAHLKIITCGSYRRGKPDCGDIDCLITHKKGHSLSGVLTQILESLHGSGFITDDLSIGKKGDVYMGVCQLQPTSLHRRIDLRIIPRESWACALLYFTGSDHFNRSMRLWARKHGYSLNEKGLFTRYTQQVKGEESVAGLKTEEDVFRALGLTYVPPEQRDV